jgi:hypothetical protein
MRLDLLAVDGDREGDPPDSATSMSMMSRPFSGGSWPFSIRISFFA